MVGGMELLTDAEHELVTKLGECFDAYTSIVGPGGTRSADLSEFAARIHDLQHAVLAQAAARAYPDRYRLAGEVLIEVRDTEPPPEPYLTELANRILARRPRCPECGRRSLRWAMGWYCQRRRCRWGL